MTSAATADSLVAAHDARLQALMAQDTVALAQVVGQDMRFTGPDGNTITRAEVVAAIPVPDYCEPRAVLHVEAPKGTSKVIIPGFVIE